MRVIAIVLACAACGAPDDVCGGSEFDSPDICVTVDVAAPGTSRLDNVYIALADRDAPTTRAPLTPALLAGAAIPTSYTAWTMTCFGNNATIDPAAADYTYESAWELSPTLTYVAAIGQLGDAAAIAASVTELQAPDATHLAASLELSTATTVEIWGLPCTSTSGECWAADPILPCARVVMPTSTFYFVRPFDRDCDGITDDVDCQPDAYCDPTATSPAAIAACTCP